MLFVGPKSPNPGKTVIPTNKFNIGPAIGFAYEVPWFGEGKTTVRGGYQVTYGQAGINAQAGGTDTLLGSAPGAFLTPTTVASDYSSILSTRALNLTDVPALVPVRPTSAPGQTVPIYGRSVTFQAYDPNHRHSVYAEPDALGNTNCHAQHYSRPPLHRDAGPQTGRQHQPQYPERLSQPRTVAGFERRAGRPGSSPVGSIAGGIESEQHRPPGLLR